MHFKSKLHTCIECAQQFDAIDLFLAHLIQQHQVYDRELLQQIKSKNVLDLSRFNIDYEKLNQNSQMSSFNGGLGQYGGQLNGGSGSNMSANANGSEYYDMAEEDYIEDEDNFDEMEGDLGEDDLDSNGRDSSEYVQNTSGKEIDYNDTLNGQDLNNTTFNKNGDHTMFYENENNMDLATSNLGVGDSELEIDFTE